MRRHALFDLLRVTWPLLAVIACLIAVGLIGMHYLRGAHAFAAGEAHWSKAQKESIIRLDRFAQTGRATEIEAFRDAMRVILGDRQARLALEQSPPDIRKATDGFIAGKNRAVDIPAMIEVVLRFRGESNLDAAFQVWREADRYIDDLAQLAEEATRLRARSPVSDDQIRVLRSSLAQLNDRIAPLEDEFSLRISEASSKMRVWIGAAGISLAVVLLTIGVYLSQRLLRQLTFYARFDPLTKLLNRHALRGELVRAVTETFTDDRTLAVMFVDLDGFKAINDALGHRAGDLVLIEIARRLQTAAGPGSTVSRLGGDEFVVLARRLPNIAAAREIAQTMIATCTQPIRVNDADLYVSASIGIAHCPVDGLDPSILLMHADTAMTFAKLEGRNQAKHYTSTMGERLGDRFRLESEIRQGLAKSEFRLHFQPIVHLASGRYVGLEALLRWQHPSYGLIHPDRFMDAAERSGLIVQLGEWVVDQACLHAKSLQLIANGRDSRLRVSVNLSPYQFRAGNFVHTVITALERRQLDGRFLCLEITETALVNHIERAIVSLQELRDRNVYISLDDFGTGYSSMAHLKRLPLDELKIDRAFVANIANDPKDAAIVRSIAQLGHILGLYVTAEGVESEAQLRRLASMGCDAAQGFWLCKPLPFEEAWECIARRSNVPLDLVRPELSEPG